MRALAILIVLGGCGGAVAPRPAAPVRAASSPPELAPLPPPDPVQLASAESFSCVLVNDGAASLSCWGTVPGAPARARAVGAADLLAVDDEIYCVSARGETTIRCFGTGAWFEPTAELRGEWDARCGDDRACVRAMERAHAAAIATGGIVLEASAPIVDVDGGDYRLCALTDRPAVECWSVLDEAPQPEARGLPAHASDLDVAADAGCVVLRSGRAFCWGQTGFWVDSMVRDVDNGGVVPSPSDVVAVRTGGTYSCLLGRSGALRCHGELEGGAASEISRLPPIRDAAVAADHACALTVEGDVYCWGDNAYGGLGNGTTARSVTPVLVTGARGSDGITVGRGYSCARRRDGSMRCWGRADAGQLGAAAVRRRWGAVQVPGVVARHVAVGGSHACALADDGWRCWGGFSGPIEELAAPRSSAWPAATVTADRVHFAGSAACVAVDGGLSCAVPPDGEVRRVQDTARLDDDATVACALSMAGTVSCGGDPLSAGGVPDNPLAGVSRAVELQVGSTVGAVRTAPGEVLRFLPEGDALAATALPDLQGATAVSAHGDVVCGVVSGRVVCVDGDGVRADLGLDRVVGLVAGIAHACALDARGAVHCWGRDAEGQLGSSPDATSSEHEARRVEGLDDAVQISAGGDNTCARRRDGTVWCWGPDVLGQLGVVPDWLAPRPVEVEGI